MVYLNSGLMQLNQMIPNMAHLVLVNFSVGAKIE